MGERNLCIWFAAVVAYPNKQTKIIAEEKILINAAKINHNICVTGKRYCNARACNAKGMHYKYFKGGFHGSAHVCIIYSPVHAFWQSPRFSLFMNQW